MTVETGGAALGKNDETYYIETRTGKLHSGLHDYR
jgi:hypothetical protein